MERAAERNEERVIRADLENRANIRGRGIPIGRRIGTLMVQFRTDRRPR
jgi:hypothetical protein